jgi:hypothetical protein
MSKKQGSSGFGLYVMAAFVVIVVVVIISQVGFAVNEISVRDYAYVDNLKEKYPEIGALVNSALKDGKISGTEFAEINIMANNVQIKRIKSSL